MGEGIRGNEKGNKGQGTRNKSQCGKMYSEKENKGVGSRIMGQGQVKRKSIMETKDKGVKGVRRKCKTEGNGKLKR